MVRNPDYLVDSYNFSSQHISTIFSKHESLMLEKFIIRPKNEELKEMFRQDEPTFSKIVYVIG